LFFFSFSTHILPVLLIQYFGSSWPALCAKFQLKKLKLTLAFPFLSHIHPDISPTATASYFSFSLTTIPPFVSLPLLLKLCPRTVSVSCWLLFDHHILFVHVNNQTPAENGKKEVKCSFPLGFFFVCLACVQKFTNFAGREERYEASNCVQHLRDYKWPINRESVVVTVCAMQIDDD
jgi:hypothetical protein